MWLKYLLSKLLSETHALVQEFDVLHEEPIDSADFGADTPINVGWGKRETQFHGKAGKPSTQAPAPVADVPFDDGCARVSWRGILTPGYEQRQRT